MHILGLKSIENFHYKGGVDLCFKIDNYETKIEAKHQEVKFNSEALKSVKRLIEDSLFKAESDTIKSLTDTNSRVAILFFTPRIKSGNHDQVVALQTTTYPVV